MTLASAPALAQTSAPSEGASTADSASDDSGEITVTARRREERLVDVPDAITALSGAVIERANLNNLGRIANLAPNLNLRNNASFGSSGLVMSMRGIANGQNGWPSVAFIVDGVPVDSLENLIGTNLEDVQQIEVLRGPQSAVYGANAIAGAINITTRQPGNEPSGRVQLDYANGNDKKVSASLSGPVIADLAAFRVGVTRRKADGLIDSASNGLHLQRTDDWNLRGQLLVTPTDRLQLNFSADYSDNKRGAVYQDLIPSLAELDTFKSSNRARRRLAGIEDREYQKYSLRLQYDLDAARLVSVTAYSKAHQSLASSGCYNDPDNPGFDNGAAPGNQTICVAGLQVYGSAATAGQPVDQAYLQDIQVESFFHDTRLQSQGSGRFKWMFGASYMWRGSNDGYDFGAIIAGPQGGANCATGYGVDLSGCQSLNLMFNRWDKRRDYWWGIYGQASYAFTDQLELTLAGRYDDQIYRDTRYTTREFTKITPVTQPNGSLGDSLRYTAKKFQPKAQLSFKPSHDWNIYASWSKGFRAGYFNYGQFVSPETTTNYEVGGKASIPTEMGRIQLSAALFHIDYSNQQITNAIATPPFVVAVIIPKTKIDGVEAEVSLTPLDGLTLSGSLGYLNSRTAVGRRSPFAPKINTNASLRIDRPLTDKLSFVGFASWTHRSGQLLNTAAPNQWIGSKNYVDARAGLRYANFEIEGFVENLTNQREVISPATPVGTAFLRSGNLPRRYGITGKFTF